MNQKNEPTKAHSQKAIPAVSTESILIIRLIAAAVLFAVTLIVNMSAILSLLIRFIAVACAGYDIVFSAVDEVEKKNYICEPTIILFVTVISFAVSYSGEATALVLLYRLSQYLTAYIKKRAEASAVELMKYQEENVSAKINEIIADDAAVKTELEADISRSSALILKAAMVIAVLYAVFVPIISNITFSTSIHRALMIILVASPASVAAAIPVVYKTAICFGAQNGIIFKNAQVIDDLSSVQTAVFDKTGIFTEGSPRLLSAESEILPTNTFMTFASHAMYYSEQPVAKAIAAQYSGDYMLDVISNFSEIPGLGVEVNLGGSHVIFAKLDYFNNLGIDIPADPDDMGQIYYMYVSDRYVGKVVLSNDFNEDSAGLSVGMKEAGIPKCVLLTEDGKKESEDAAAELEFDAFYSNCTPAKKRDVLMDIAERSSSPVLYIYASGIEAHSAAKVDIRIARKGKYADALVLPQNIASIPLTVGIGARAKELVSQNAIFVFIVKALLIFLAMNGLSTLWFALFLNVAAEIATYLNCIRITNNSQLFNFNFSKR